MRVAGYIWIVFIVVRNLLGSFLIFAIFNSIHDPFSQTVASALLLIYLKVSFFQATWGKATTEQYIALSNEFRHIRTFVGKERDESIALENETLAQAVEEAKEFNVKFWINSAFTLCFWVFGLYKLITAL
jgi:hypothetical protein